MEYLRYSEMKDSGIEWLGEIPEHWGDIKLKYLVNTLKGKNPKKTIDEKKNGFVPYLSVSVLRGNENKIKYGKVNKKTILVKKGDILIIWDGSNSGEVIMSKIKGILSSTMNKINIMSQINKKYFYYYLINSEQYIKNNRTGMGIPHVNSEIFNNLFVLMPKLKEQKVIADFLDQETDRINKLIDKKERLIELLEEKRQAMISETVTKGLDPDVEMKDSGVEWLGKIPEHWSKVKGRYVLKIVNGYSPQEISMINDGFDYFKVDDLNQAGDGFFLNGSKKKIKGEKNKLIKPQIILIPKRGEAIYTNKVRIAKNECSFDTNIMGLKSKEKNEIEYLGYVLKTRKLDDVADVSSIPQINNKHINNLYIPIPPFDEQKNIIDYIKNKTKKLDSLINKIKAQISNLKEYRKTLITKAVTGKIDVIDLAE